MEIGVETLEARELEKATGTHAMVG